MFCDPSRRHSGARNPREKVKKRGGGTEGRREEGDRARESPFHAPVNPIQSAVKTLFSTQDSLNSIGHATEILGNNLDEGGTGSPKHALYALYG